MFTSGDDGRRFGRCLVHVCITRCRRCFRRCRLSAAEKARDLRSENGTRTTRSVLQQTWATFWPLRWKSGSRPTILKKICSMLLSSWLCMLPCLTYYACWPELENVKEHQHYFWSLSIFRASNCLLWIQPTGINSQDDNSAPIGASSRTFSN